MNKPQPKFSLQQFAKSLPDHPGVYFWKDKNGKILYVGKATSLRDRVSSYFTNSLEPSKAQMVWEARRIDFELADTVLEALMIETNYIKKLKPKYNILSRDDKSMAYLAFTKEDYPRLIIIRAKDLERYKAGDPIQRRKYKIGKTFGPFFASSTIEKILKLLSPIFMFRVCNNKPDDTCFYGRIGQCPLHNRDPLTKDEYKRNLDKISSIFKGSTKSLKVSLKKEMEKYSKANLYEEAASARDQLYALQHVNDIALIEEYTDVTGIPQRLEAYDISHFGGKQAVGAFVVYTNGKPEKSQYRKFNIKWTDTQDDPQMMAEVVKRRLNHTEWPFPDMILLDGGITQLRAVQAVLEHFEIPGITLVASAKGPDRKNTDLRRAKPAESANFNQIKLLKIIRSAQSEVHRFVITFQKKKRKLNLDK